MNMQNGINDTCDINTIEQITAAEEQLLREALLRSQPEMQPDVDKEWKQFAEKTGIAIPVHRRRNIWIATIAAACIAAAFFFLGTNIGEMKVESDNTSKICEVTTSDGQRCQLTLPDGTKIWLSSGSKVKYPLSFNGKERNIELQGEAFFDVHKDSSHPFVVKTPYITTRVYGTQFNIRCYTEQDCNVHLVTGSIEVAQNKHNSQPRMMVPGEDVKFTESGELVVTQSAPEATGHLSWQDGEFRFDNVDLSIILSELSMWYGISVIFHDDSASHQKVHFTMERNTSLDDAVELLNSLCLSRIELHDGRIVVEKK